MFKIIWIIELNLSQTSFRKKNGNVPFLRGTQARIKGGMDSGPPRYRTKWAPVGNILKLWVTNTLIVFIGPPNPLSPRPKIILIRARWYPSIYNKLCCIRLKRAYSIVQNIYLYIHVCMLAEITIRIISKASSSLSLTDEIIRVKPSSSCCCQYCRRARCYGLRYIWTSISTVTTGYGIYRRSPRT